MSNLLEQLRQAELETVKAKFRPGLRVLEIGGGRGYQASVIASWGCDLMSIDLATRPFAKPYLFPVQDYNGVHIPADDESFDLIFSSNVLEHVRSLPTIFTEMRRVMKPDAVAIHILPTPSWRFWTSLTHYGDLLRAQLGLRPTDPAAANGSSNTPAADSASEPSLSKRIKRAMFSEAHGEYPNAVSELYYYSRRRWLRVFKQNGFEVEEVIRNKIFYTGYALLPSMSIEMRRALSGWLGAACLVYVMKKSDSLV